MGQRGPVPKRSTERRRRNKDNAVETVSAAGEVRRPDPDPDWHPIALAWFDSLGESGQAQFYEPSDWQAARYVAEVMSRHLSAGRLSAQLFAAVWSAMGELLTTEAARRRARVEVEREGKAPVDAGVSVLDEYRARLAKS